jgi:hypothetical protein
VVCWLNTGGAGAFGWPSRRVNTSARTGRKWNERSIQDVMVIMRTLTNGDCGLREWLTLIRDRVVQKPWPIPNLEWVVRLDVGWDFRPIYVGRTAP